MKKLSFYLLMALIAIPMMQSCDDDDSIRWIERMATIRLISGNAFYLETDTGRRLEILNNNAYWYTPIEGQRVIVNYTPLSDATGTAPQSISVNYIRDVLTKTVEELTAENAEEIGNDPVWVEDMWIGSNYLNVQFRFPVPINKRHRVSLVENTTVENPNDGYIHLEYRYNNENDISNVWARSFVSFNLGEYAPGVASGQYKGIIVTINSAINGIRPLQFDFTNNSGNERTINNGDDIDPTDGKVE